MIDFTFSLATSDPPIGESINPLLLKIYGIIWSAVPLVATLALPWKLVLPEFQEVLTEREDRIEGDIERVEAAQTEAKVILGKYNNQFAEAYTEAAKVRDEACTQGQRIITDATARVNDGNTRTIKSDEEQLVAQREQIVAELHKETDQNSINLTECPLGEQLPGDVCSSLTTDSFSSNPDTMALVGK